MSNLQKIDIIMLFIDSNKNAMLIQLERNCLYINKQYYICYFEKKGIYGDCEKLLPKYSSDNMILIILFKIQNIYF